MPTGLIAQSRIMVRILLAGLLVVCMAGFSLAQNTNAGDIRGTVTDSTGAVIPGVSVTLLNTETGVTTQLVTNEAGIYDAVSILPGKYRSLSAKRVSKDLCEMASR